MRAVYLPQSSPHALPEVSRSGMHWSVSGANAIIALRCSKLSGRFEDFWERRSTSLQAAA